MRPTERMVRTGRPPRSRRKAAAGTRATATRALWENEEGEESSRLLEEDDEEEAAAALVEGERRKGPGGLGFRVGEAAAEEEGPLKGVGKEGALAEAEMKARWRAKGSSGIIVSAGEGEG